MRLGNINLYIASDGTYQEDGGSLFGLVPKALWERIMAPDDHNRLPVEMRCLVVETREQLILVGTGYGDKLTEHEREHLSLTGERRLVKSLGELGIEPEDIDLVVNTHLHGDHCGGNTIYDGNGDAVPTFPRATYCVQRLELADAMFPNVRSRAAYREENFRPVQQSRQLRTLWGDTWLSAQVRVTITPGHTRAHQCVVIEDGGQMAIFLGDIAAWPIHVERLAWVPAYDVEPLVSIETKRRLARWAIEKGALLIFEHHPETVAGLLHPTERPDRFSLEPVEWTQGAG
jgi:glyoxylase-like metal-dependent hydrolase (beta-lactamase superfamily II)